MAITPHFTRGLQAFYEAESLLGIPNGDTVSLWPDLSTNGRDLTVGKTEPIMKTNAINGKRAIEFNEHSLQYSGAVDVKCGFLVLKHTGDFGAEYEGILTGLTNGGILVGIPASNLWFDFQYNCFEYRIDNKIEPANNAHAPNSGFSVLFFRFWTGITLDGIQLGQDRDFNTRHGYFEIAALALYDRFFCEADINKQINSFANSYQIAQHLVFPYQGMKADTVTQEKRILTDGRDEPTIRLKREARKTFAATFARRSQAELNTAETFWKDAHPVKRFIYRDYQLKPPVDTVCRFPETSRLARAGSGYGDRVDYSLDFVESVKPAATAIPAAPVIPIEP